MTEILRHRRARAVAGVGALAAVLMLSGGVAAQSPSGPPASPASDAAASAGPARPAPTPQALQLGAVIANGYVESALADMPSQFNDMFNMPIFKSAVFHQAPFNDPALAERFPGWIEAGRHAMFAAAADCKPRVEALLAHALAEHLSIDELRAGARFINSPGGQYAAQVYMHERPPTPIPASLSTGPMAKEMAETVAEANARAHRPLPAAAQSALLELNQTPAGRQFVGDILSANVWMKDYRTDYLWMVMGPMFLHLSEDLAADQARRDAAAKDAPTPEATALGVSVVHGAYAAVDDKAWTALTTVMNGVLAKVPMTEVTKSGASPELIKLSVSTVLESLRYDQPVIEKSVGRALARLCSEDDLKALADFMNGPAPAYYVNNLVATLPGAGGHPGAAPPPPEVQASLEKFAASGAQERLSARLRDPAAKEQLAEIGIDAGVPIAAQWMHRFGEESEKINAKRQAARGW